MVNTYAKSLIDPNHYKRRRRLVAIGAVAVEIAAYGDQLWNYGQLAPATRVGHSPAKPVDAGSQGQAGGVIGRRGKADEGFCQRIGLVPPRQSFYFKGPLHINYGCTIDHGTEEHKSGFRKVLRIRFLRERVCFGRTFGWCMRTPSRYSEKWTRKRRV